MSTFRSLLVVSNWLNVFSLRVYIMLVNAKAGYSPSISSYKRFFFMSLTQAQLIVIKEFYRPMHVVCFKIDSYYHSSHHLEELTAYHRLLFKPLYYKAFLNALFNPHKSISKKTFLIFPRI